MEGTPSYGVAYGTTSGQLGAMPAGGFDSAISSPPHGETITYQQPGAGGEGNELMRQGYTVQEIAEMRRKGDPRVLATRRDAGYSRSPDNLGNMPAGGFEAAVSSPPYANVNLNCGETQVEFEERLERIKAGGSSWWRPRPTGNFAQPDYGTSDGQLATDTDFWTAARTIVEQVYTVLRPGAHAIWVLKAYVRDKRIVDFPDQWRQMCEACGFETLHVHRAWLVEEHGAQGTLDGGVKRKRTERKSFFRRLAESKGSPRIDYEIVLCQVKPMDAASQSGQASACVSSPPYAESLNSKGNGIDDSKMVHERGKRKYQQHGNLKDNQCYGADPANLGNMRPGDFDAAVKPLNSNGKGDTQ